ncbi:hypothetical protein AVEN_140434-1 [Araneus ventricosus]|uniref:RNase H type-1 domain-containing protein n=1 Tax=Araneus ventricosus TaxID=182803 RepID=A0A4Y2VNW3_ARAVE|nr:hypothetical protein AVEN_140434-1 [Araneus ventricosus]
MTTLVRGTFSFKARIRDVESLLPQEQGQGFFKSLNVSPNQIITFPKAPVFQCEICKIHTSDSDFQNKAQPTAIIEELFNDFISNNSEDSFIIATDASKSLTLTSIACISNQHSFVFRKHPINSIFTVEALAICQAIDDLSNPEKNLMILTDSLSVLQALKSISIRSPKIIHRLHHKKMIREKSNKKIKLIWTAGLSNISWNEKADFLARTATNSTPYLNCISAEDIISHLQKISIQKPTETFRNSKYYDSLGDIPSVVSLSPWLKHRREEITISRILTRMIITPSLLHKFDLYDNPTCHKCNQENDIEHILLNCTQYRAHRIKLWEKLQIDTQTPPS